MIHLFGLHNQRAVSRDGPMPPLLIYKDKIYRPHNLTSSRSLPDSIVQPEFKSRLLSNLPYSLFEEWLTRQKNLPGMGG